MKIRAFPKTVAEKLRFCGLVTVLFACTLAANQVHNFPPEIQVPTGNSPYLNNTVEGQVFRRNEEVNAINQIASEEVDPAVKSLLLTYLIQSRIVNNLSLDDRARTATIPTDLGQYMSIDFQTWADFDDAARPNLTPTERSDKLRSAKWMLQSVLVHEATHALRHGLFQTLRNRNKCEREAYNAQLDYLRLLKTSHPGQKQLIDDLIRSVTASRSDYVE